MQSIVSDATRTLQQKLQAANQSTRLNDFYKQEFARGMANLQKIVQMPAIVIDAGDSDREEITWEQYQENREKLKEETNSIKKKRKKAAIQRTDEMGKAGSHKKTLSRELREQTGYSRQKKVPTLGKKPDAQVVDTVQAVDINETPRDVKFELYSSQPQANPTTAKPSPAPLVQAQPQASFQTRPKRSDSFSPSHISFAASSIRGDQGVRSRKPTNASMSLSILKLRKIQSDSVSRKDAKFKDTASIKEKSFKSSGDQKEEEEEQGGREKSIYSIALESRLSKRKKSPSQKGNKPKINFMKAFLEKKYKTEHLSQIHHRFEKQNELQVRELKRLGMINFSQVMHQRKASKDAIEELQRQRQAFEIVKHSIEREMNQPFMNPIIEEGDLSSVVVKRTAKPVYEDTTSAMENIEIKEYEIEQSMISQEKQIQTEESMVHYQAIYEAFQSRDRSRRSNKGLTPQKSLNKSQFLNKNEESDKRNITYEQEKSQVMTKKGSIHKAIIEHPSEQNHTFAQSKNIDSLEQQQHPTLEEQYNQKIIGDQLFGFANNITFFNNPYFQEPLQRLIRLANKVKYSKRQSLSSTKEHILLLLNELLSERQKCKSQFSRLNKQISYFKYELAEYLDSNGQPLKKEYKYADEVSRVLSQASSLNIDQEQDLDKSIIVNKVVIGKVIAKSCQLLELNLKRSIG